MLLRDADILLLRKLLPLNKEIWMEVQPEEYRLLLLELIYEVTKVSRYYRGRILHAPVYIEAPG